MCTHLIISLGAIQSDYQFLQEAHWQPKTDHSTERNPPHGTPVKSLGRESDRKRFTIRSEPNTFECRLKILFALCTFLQQHISTSVSEELSSIERHESFCRGSNRNSLGWNFRQASKILFLYLSEQGRELLITGCFLHSFLFVAVPVSPRRGLFIPAVRRFLFVTSFWHYR